MYSIVCVSLSYDTPNVFSLFSVKYMGSCPLNRKQGELVAKFAPGVVDTGGKFAAGVVDTGGNLPPVSLIPVANLPPVSLTPVVHLDLRLSPRIFEKIRNDPNVIIRGLGEGDS
jgi:hypothetical protein